jgi:LmbE family N-acetylglucosaminyl deacetylase
MSMPRIVVMVQQSAARHDTGVTAGSNYRAAMTEAPKQPDLEPFPEDWERGMAIVAHPDDLEYGCASAIARFTDQGKDVTYVLASAGEAGIDGMEPAICAGVRMKEERRGAALVGVENVEFLDHQDGVIEYSLDLRRDFARMIRRYRPEILITSNHYFTWGGPGLNMADHRNVGLAAIDAARDAGNRWVFPELLDEGLEPWRGARRIFVNASPFPSHAVDVTYTIDRGIASLRAHEAYLAGLGADGMPDPAPFLRGIAEQAGERFGGRLAVTFEIFEW